MEKEKKVFKSQTYEKKKPVIKKNREKAKKEGRIKFEITGLKEKTKNSFSFLKDVCDLTNAELLEAMVKYCDTPDFKRYAIDKEYLEVTPNVYIV